jgi:tetratricopeptide (TPR) repeat protein
MLIILPGFLAGYFFVIRERVTPQERLQQARAALQQGAFADAESLAQMVPEQDPSFGDAMMIAAEAASRQTALDRAEQAYQAAVRAGCSDPMLARFCLADVQMHAGNLSASIAGFRSILQQEPGDVATHSRLAYLYAATARRWECRPHLEAVLKSGAATLNELVLLADLERPVQNESFLRSCAEAYPRDENVRLGLAAIAVENGDVAQAISELLALTREQPSLLSAHVLLGELLANERSRRFEDWHRTLPDSADTWPGIWFVRGLRALTWEDRGMAARCFGSAIQLAPGASPGQLSDGPRPYGLGGPGRRSVRRTRQGIISSLAATARSEPDTRTK